MASPFHPQAPNGTKVPTADATEPSRPRRKKARRACSSCQKSHQTCGNERPCQSCVRRGCAESCRDGERKKPKYLEEGSYRVFTIQYNVPFQESYTSAALTPFNHTIPCGNSGLQARTPSPNFGQPLYLYQDCNPWTMCAEDPFIGEKLNDTQIELKDRFLLDPQWSNTIDQAAQTDAVLAFAIGSGWSSTFLRSEYDDSV